MNVNNLSDLSRDQLLELAGKQGLSVHHKAKPETIIKQIVDHMLTPQQPQVNQPPLEHYDPRLAPKKEPVFNTPEQVEEAIAHIKAAQPKFEALYNREERTVLFRCLGAEECHNLSVPLRVLVQKASMIKRGRIAPIGHRPTDFEPGNSGGLSAYTNVVLAG